MGSDNRAVPALGRAVGLNPELLVDEMNKRAKLMGLKHTKFVEPTGIDHDNVSTAKEILYILKAASMNRVLSIVMSKASYDAKEVGTGRKITYNNTNLLQKPVKILTCKGNPTKTGSEYPLPNKHNPIHQRDISLSKGNDPSDS
jgi:D-alanyl-D-alanine carboxypeptidase